MSEPLPPEAPIRETMPIVQIGDAVLRRPAAPVTPAAIRSPEFQRLIEVMHATMDLAPGVGLAAPQVGLSIRLAVLADGPDRWGDADAEHLASRERAELPFTVFVNPLLVVLPDERPTAGFYEGCLSVARLTGFVRRHRVVRVDALDHRGEPASWTLSGWAARIAQHEIDHLDGILYLDRVATRSLTTTANYAEFWAGRPVGEIAAGLGFDPGG
jgi:peptide deformylase